MRAVKLVRKIINFLKIFFMRCGRRRRSSTSGDEWKLNCACISSMVWLYSIDNNHQPHHRPVPSTLTIRTCLFVAIQIGGSQKAGATAWESRRDCFCYRSTLRREKSDWSRVLERLLIEYARGSKNKKIKLTAGRQIEATQKIPRNFLFLKISKGECLVLEKKKLA